MFLMLRGYSLKLFENRMLRQIFGSEIYENRDWKSIYDEELHSLQCSLNIVWVIKSRRLRWAGHVARKEECTSALTILTSKPTGTRPLGRPRLRMEENIRMDNQKIYVTTRNCIGKVLDRDC